MARGSGDTSLGGEHAFDDKLLAKFDTEGLVDAEDGDGDAADRRKADQICALPAEVFCPFVAAGIE